jgi:hypothetical protein
LNEVRKEHARCPVLPIDVCLEAVGGIRVKSTAGYKYLEDPPIFFQLYKERIKPRKEEISKNQGDNKINRICISF